MTKIAVVGDLHGNTRAAVRLAKVISRHKINKIVQVGDFGLWDHFDDGITFLDTLNEELRRTGAKVYAIGGNHENWLRWNWYVENNPTDKYGFTMLRTHIMIAPKTFHWSWEGKQFAAAGGAVSIDKEYRLHREKESGLGPNNLFWWDEQLLDTDVMAFPERKVDYLFTHDCSNATPFRNRIKPDMDSQIHRQRIDDVLRKCAPEIHFHGHMHTKYDWMNLTNGIVGQHYVQTYGLECDGMFWNWGSLNLSTDEFVFAPVLAPSTF